MTHPSSSNRSPLSSFLCVSPHAKSLKFLTLPSLIQTSKDQHPSQTKRREKSASTNVCRVKSTEVHSTPSPQSVMQLRQQRLSARTNSTVNTARIPRLTLILSLVWRHTRRGYNRKSTRFPSCLDVHSVHLLRQHFFAMTNALQTKNSSRRNSGQHLRAKQAMTSANILIAPTKRNQLSWQV